MADRPPRARIISDTVDRMVRERRRGPSRRGVLLALATLLLWTPPAFSQASYSEESVKAALLEKVVSFLEWATPAPPSRPLTVAVLGNDALAGELQHLFAERPFAGRKLVVRRVAKPAQAGDADIVVVGGAEARELPNVLKACAREGVLVVGDGPGLAEAGAAINFFREGARLRFEVRPSALKQARIKASYKLLGVARIVGES
jgi:hypothetical protein